MQDNLTPTLSISKAEDDQKIIEELKSSLEIGEEDKMNKKQC